MLSERLRFEIPSMSCGEHRPSHLPNIIVPQMATTEMVNRFAVLRDTLSSTLDGKNISLSLHVGYATDVSKAKQLLSSSNVQVSSLDIPDVYTLKRFVHDLKPRIKDKDIAKLLKSGGRKIQSVGSEKLLYRKLNKGVNAFTKDKPLLLRTHAGLWLETNLGDRLRSMFKGNPNIAFAVEMLSKYQTPDEYMEFIRQLSLTNDINTPVYADLDLGHIEEAGYLHQERAGRKEALAVYEDILSDEHDSKLVACTSLNQYDGGDETHASLIHGPLDLTEAMKILGKAKSRGTIVGSQTVIVEFYPMDYPTYVSSEGVAFCANLRNAYDTQVNQSSFALEEVV